MKEQARQAFEKWASTYYCDFAPADFEKNEMGEYVDPNTQDAWEPWEACLRYAKERAVEIVEGKRTVYLSKNPLPSDRAWNQAVDAIAAAIEKGLSDE